MILFARPLLTLTALAVGATFATSARAADRPNFVLILADDMGFSDIGPYGSEIPTPTLDRLAAHGLRFTEFYNAARCCPTRASLLTGLYPHQTGIGNMVVDQGLPGYRGDLNDQCITIAQALKPAGYRSYLAGKWHVTKHTDMFLDWVPEQKREYTSKHNWPLQRGFDRFHGTIHGAGSFFDPASLVDGNEPVRDLPADYYYTDAISDHAAAYIREHRQAAPGQPFFLYVAYTAPHWPLHAREEDIARHRGRYDGGWDALRQQRLRRLTAQGIVSPDTKLSARPDSVPAWEDAPDKPVHARAMEIYAAQVESMDRGIGRIVRSLEQTGVYEDTVVLFLSDNGGCAEVITERWPRSLHMPAATRDGRPIAKGLAASGAALGRDTSYASYGVGWANASNTPFREFKHYIHEGGIATPLIVSWPRGLPAERRGTLTSQPGHVKDLLPTLLELAGATYPERHDGRPLTPLAGVSLAPALQGRPVATGPIFWEHHGNRGVRDGRWKLVAEQKGEWELYDLSVDRIEANNLAATHPEVVARLRQSYLDWAKRVGVVENPPKPKRKD